MIPYSDERHDCGGTILAGDPVSAGPDAPAYWHCERCDAFRFADLPGCFPSGTNREANREAWNAADLCSPDAPPDDPPDPDYDGPFVPTGGAT